MQRHLLTHTPEHWAATTMEIANILAQKTTRP
jgi:hypothetical protein